MTRRDSIAARRELRRMWDAAKAWRHLEAFATRTRRPGETEAEAMA